MPELAAVGEQLFTAVALLLLVAQVTVVKPLPDVGLSCEQDATGVFGVLLLVLQVVAV